MIQIKFKSICKEQGAVGLEIGGGGGMSPGGDAVTPSEQGSTSAEAPKP